MPAAFVVSCTGRLVPSAGSAGRQDRPLSRKRPRGSVRCPRVSGVRTGPLCDDHVLLLRWPAAAGRPVEPGWEEVRAGDGSWHGQVRSCACRQPGDHMAVDAVVQRALDTFDFGDLIVLSKQVGLSAAEARQARRLAHLGRLLLELDLEDLERSAATLPDLAPALAPVMLPAARSADGRGLLDSLVPVAGLVLEVVQVRWQQADIASLLAAVHLLGEYLPLGVWEPVLGHAADPVRLAAVVSGPTSSWGTAACPATTTQRRACRAVTAPGRGARDWTSYLDSDHAFVAEVLARCATCSQACAVAAMAQDAEDRGQQLRARTALAGDLAHGRLVGRRHASPVGHAFALDGREEIAQAWAQDWGRLRQRHGDLLPNAAASPYVLPGLPEVLSAVCGVPVAPSTLIAGVVARLSDLLLSGDRA